MTPLEDRPRFHDTMLVTRRALRGLYDSPIPQMAAALAYRTIFGMIPVLVVSLLILKLFASEDDIRDLVRRTLEFTGISRIVVESHPIDAALGPPVIVHHEPPRLEAWVQDRLVAIQDIPLRAIGGIVIATLIYAAISMLVEIEQAFNQIYRARAGRSWGRRITQYWTIITLGSIALFATFYVGEKFREWVRHLTEDGSLTGGGITLSLAGFLATVVISTLLFLFTYTSVPNTRVKFGPALVGATLAALAWETGKWGFTQYLSYSASYERLYGSIALIPLFLLWVYVTWLIVLLGLQVAYGLQTLKLRLRDTDPDPVIVDPASILGVVALIARRFADGRTTDPETLVTRTGLSQTVVTRMLDRLADSGILLRVEGEDAFALARPPEAILADEVLRAAHELTVKPFDDLATGAVADRIREARLEIGRGVTMASLVKPGPGEARTVPTAAAPPAGPAGP